MQAATRTVLTICLIVSALGQIAQTQDVIGSHTPQAKGSDHHLEKTTPHNAVLTLNNSNFDDYIQEFPFLLAKFYVSWCPECREMAADYTQLAQHFEAERIPVKIGEIECSMEKVRCSMYEITKYPTLIFFNNDHQLRYTGQNTLPAMLDWITQQIDKALGEEIEDF